ncbi:MAG TPA: hypothetical protein VD713_02735, partial [Sphingomonadales bacterium]|nr:hypothetical protein [Sphingomonadales bacterium]
EFDANNARALETLVHEYDVQIKTFPEDVLKELKKVSHQVLEETAAGDELTGRVHQSFHDSLERTSHWGDVAERHYAHAREL